MFQMFPRMRDRPAPKQIGMGIGYWLAYLFLLPSLLSFFLVIEELSPQSFTAVGIVFWVINFLVVGLAFRTYLIDSALSVQLYPKNFLRALAIGLGVLLAVQLPLNLVGFTFSRWLFMETNVLPLPIADMPYGNYYGLSPIIIAFESPVLGTLCMVTIVPVVMSCLYYAVGFAPFGGDKAWLGYVMVVLIALVQNYINIGITDLSGFLMQCLCVLPFHLCACWVYQQTDSIWGPILFHAVANLASIVLCFITMPFIGVTF